eukprot:6189194-Pleurochrysis_carterae.AAC.1
MGLANYGHKLSTLMQALLPPAYRDGEAEGEETSPASSVACSPARLMLVPAPAPSTTIIASQPSA